MFLCVDIISITNNTVFKQAKEFFLQSEFILFHSLKMFKFSNSAVCIVIMASCLNTLTCFNAQSLWLRLSVSLIPLFPMLLSCIINASALSYSGENVPVQVFSGLLVGTITQSFLTINGINLQNTKDDVPVT